MSKIIKWDKTVGTGNGQLKYLAKCTDDLKVLVLGKGEDTWYIVQPRWHLGPGLSSWERATEDHETGSFSLDRGILHCKTTNIHQRAIKV